MLRHLPVLLPALLLFVGGLVLGWLGVRGIQAQATESNRQAEEKLRFELQVVAQLAPDLLLDPSVPATAAWTVHEGAGRDVTEGFSERLRELFAEIDHLVFTRREPAQALAVLGAVEGELVGEAAALGALRRAQSLRALGRGDEAAGVARKALALGVQEGAWDPKTTRLCDILRFHAARGGTATARAAAELALVRGLGAGAALYPEATMDPGTLLAALYPGKPQAAWPELLRRAFQAWQQGHAVLQHTAEEGLTVLLTPQVEVVVRRGTRLRRLDPTAILRRRSELEHLRVRSRLSGPQVQWTDVALPSPLSALTLSAPKSRPQGVSPALRWTLALALAAYLAGVVFLAWATIRRRRAARLQSDFVAAVSHEMKTPIASVRAMAEFLLDEPGLGPRARTYAGNMVREMERLGGSVRDVLDVARIERAGRLQLDTRPEDPCALLTRLVEQLTPVVEAHGRTLEAALEPTSDGKPVALDSEALTGAVRNLVDNAVKFAPAGSTVTLTGRAVEGSYRIEVLDRGPGIDPAHARRIFKRFIRGKAAKNGAVAGVGLGLHVVSEVVLAHGGAVRAENREGGGARFTVTLPQGERA